MTCTTRPSLKTALSSSGESPRLNLRPDSYMAVFLPSFLPSSDCPQRHSADCGARFDRLSIVAVWSAAGRSGGYCRLPRSAAGMVFPLAVRTAPVLYGGLGVCGDSCDSWRRTVAAAGDPRDRPLVLAPRQFRLACGADCRRAGGRRRTDDRFVQPRLARLGLLGCGTKGRGACRPSSRTGFSPARTTRGPHGTAAPRCQDRRPLAVCATLR
jgi:hypothetical protein